MKFRVQYTAPSSYEAVLDPAWFPGFDGDPEDADEFADWLERHGWELEFGDLEWRDTEESSVEITDVVVAED